MTSSEMVEDILEEAKLYMELGELGRELVSE